jgi:hypothetical protein
MFMAFVPETVKSPGDGRPIPSVRRSFLVAPRMRSGRHANETTKRLGEGQLRRIADALGDLCDRLRAISSK